MSHRMRHRFTAAATCIVLCNAITPRKPIGNRFVTHAKRLQKVIMCFSKASSSSKALFGGTEGAVNSCNQVSKPWFLEYCQAQVHMFGIKFMRLTTSAALVIHLLLLASPTALAESCPERPYTQTEVALYTRSLRIAEALPPKPAGFDGGLGMDGNPSVPMEQIPITTGFSSATGVTTLSGNAQSTSCVGLPAIGSIKFGVGYRTKTEVTYARPATEKWLIQSIGSSLTEEEAFSDRPPKAKPSRPAPRLAGGDGSRQPG